MKPNRLIFSVALILILSLSGCSNSGISQSDYDSISSELNAVKKTIDQKDKELAELSSEKTDLEEQISALKSQVTQLTNQIDSLQSEYDSYKSQMSEYEDLSAAEAEARRIEAEAIIRAEQEAKEKAEQEAAAEAEAKEKAGYDTGITYDQLARTPDEYEGELVKFTGKVLQVIEGDNEIDIRLAVNKDYDTVIYCGYNPNIVSSRVLEDDTVTIYGTSLGLYSYKSTIGGKITIPAVWVDKIDQ